MPKKYDITVDAEKIVAVNTTLSLADIRRRASIVATSDGITVTLPAPRRDLWKYEIPVFNYSSGYIAVECIGYLQGTLNSFTLAPKEHATITCVKVDSATTYKWALQDTKQFEDGWTTWTPTIVYSTGTPAGSLVETCRYQLRDGICHYDVEITATDGKGCTQVAIPPPAGAYPYPAGSGVEIPAMSGEQLVDTTVTNPSVYMDVGNATIASRVITTRNLSTATSGKAFALRASGWYEYDGSFLAFTQTISQTGGPSTLATVSRYKNSGGLIYFYSHSTSADGKGTTAVTCTPPLAARDLDTKIPIALITKIDTTWASPTDCFLDMNDATVTNRIIGVDNAVTWTNGKALQYSMAGIYPLDKEVAFTPTVTQTAGPMTVAGLKGYYKVVNNICWVNVYFTSTDGKAVSAIGIKPPVAPKYAARKIMVRAAQLVNTTTTNPLAYLAADAAAPASRTIAHYNLSACTTGQAFAYRLVGAYEV
jgi:hypothetical protein